MAYTSLTVLKDYLGIPSSTSSEDTPLTAAINAAQDLVEGYCNTTFETVTGGTVPTIRRCCSSTSSTPSPAWSNRHVNDGTYDTTLTINDLWQPFNEPLFTPCSTFPATGTSPGRPPLAGSCLRRPERRSRPYAAQAALISPHAISAKSRSAS